MHDNHPPPILSEEAATVIAADHLAHLKPPTGWNYAETTGRELADDWYFDYRLEPVEMDRDESFGGAPGFFISKATGRIRIASWSEPRI